MRSFLDLFHPADANGCWWFLGSTVDVRSVLEFGRVRRAPVSADPLLGDRVVSLSRRARIPFASGRKTKCVAGFGAFEEILVEPRDLVSWFVQRRLACEHLNPVNGGAFFRTDLHLHFRRGVDLWHGAGLSFTKHARVESLAHHGGIFPHNRFIGTGIDVGHPVG